MLSAATEILATSGSKSGIVDANHSAADPFVHIALFADELEQSEQKEASQFENEETQEDDDFSSYISIDDFKSKEKNAWESTLELECFHQSKRPFFLLYKSWKLDFV